MANQIHLRVQRPYRFEGCDLIAKERAYYHDACGCYDPQHHAVPPGRLEMPSDDQKHYNAHDMQQQSNLIPEGWQGYEYKLSWTPNSSDHFVCSQVSDMHSLLPPPFAEVAHDVSSPVGGSNRCSQAPAGTCAPCG